MPLWNRFTQGLDTLMGSPQLPQGGVMGEPQVNPQQDARLALASSLLAGSNSGQGFNQIFGKALMAGQAARQQAQQFGQQSRDQQSQEQLRQAQIQQMQRPEQEPMVAVMDPKTGKPVYVPRAQAAGMAPAVDSNSAIPANIQEALWYENATPEQRAFYDKQNGREQAPYFQWVQRLLPDGSTQQGTFNARTGQTSWDEKAVPAGTKPRVDAAGAAIGEAEGSQAGKAPAKASMDYVLNELESQLSQTTQGGIGGVVGKVGSVTDYKDAKRFDNLREQLSTELRTVFRIPGEGTLSDREQAQYGVQLPDRNNPAEVNAKILKDLRERTRLRTETPMGPWRGPGTPISAAAPAGGGWSAEVVE